MANRIDGNVYIIDTGSGDTAIPFLNSDILGVGAWFSGPTGEVRFSTADTTNVFLRLSATLSAGACSNYVYLGGLCVDDLKVPVLTAGTAWIYLK